MTQNVFRVKLQKHLSVLKNARLVFCDVLPNGTKRQSDDSLAKALWVCVCVWCVCVRVCVRVRV